MDAISQMTFSNILNENVWVTIKIPLKFVLKGSTNSIGSDNGLALTRQQSIVWTNDG